jgi:chaperonin cofactor prefoldin
MADEKEIKKLNDKIDRLQKTVDELRDKLYTHIQFIDSTYEGLKNPIEAARKWLRR